MEQLLSPPGDMHALLALVLASAVIMGSPGPATVSVASVGAAFGLRGSLRYAAGLVAGTSAVLLGVVFGLAAMLTSVPQLAPLLLAISTAYVCYMALGIATAPPLTDRLDVAVPSFHGGFFLAIANPKAYLAIAAVFAGSLLDPVSKTMLLAAMIVVIHAGWLVVGSSFSRLLRDPVASRIANVLLAAVLVATAVASVI